MALRPGKQRLSATPIIAKGVLYPLQNPRASKLATHGFASKSDTRHTEKGTHSGALFCGWDDRLLEMTLQNAKHFEKSSNLAVSPLKHTLVSAFFDSEVF